MIKKTFYVLFVLVFVGNIFAGDLLVSELTDTNLDLQTNIVDFVNLSEYWQWKDLRNADAFDTYQDYAGFWDPNTSSPLSFQINGKQFDFNKNSSVDFADLAVLSAGWLSQAKVYQNGGSGITVEFIEAAVDVNDLVHCQVSGFQYPPNKIYLVLDTKIIDTIIISDINTSSGVVNCTLETSRHPNGSHQLSVIAVDNTGETLEVSSPFDISFNNLLSNDDSSDFYTSSGYFISGKYEGDRKLKLTVRKNGTNVYTRILTANDINCHVPKDVFTDGDVVNYEVSLAEMSESNLLAQNTPSAPLMQVSQLTQSYSNWNKKIYRKFDPSEYDTTTYTERVLFLLPDPDITQNRFDAIEAEMQACRERNKDYLVLFYHDVNHANLHYIFTNMKRINTLFFHGKANVVTTGSNGTEVFRTYFQCWKLQQLPNGNSKYFPSRAFSYRDTVPLPGNWETEGFFIEPYRLSMGLVLMDGCRTAYFSDMANAMCSSNYRYENYAYMGWIVPTHTGSQYYWPVNEGFKILSQALGRRDTVEDGLIDIAVEGPRDTQIEFWGDDRLIDGTFNGDDNFRFFRHGYSANIYLGEYY